MTGTSRPDLISTRQARIAALAEQAPDMRLTTLSHHIDIDWLKEAYGRTRKDGAPGIDGLTAADYEANLEENLQSLLNRAKTGRYRAPAVRRVHIPKGTGKETRPLGIPTFEDKVLQRAVLMVLEAVYEQDFLDCSYGFRRGRSQHDAIKAIWKATMNLRGGWVVEVDLRKYFDTVVHKHLREILSQRVRDGVLVRLIGKWLNAGVMEDGELWFPKQGTPQGGVISPLLANLYLHAVLDEWFANTVKPRLEGVAYLIRYADDFVIVCRHKRDAERLMDVLPKRFEKYGLAVHPTKTRLVDFRHPDDDAEERSRGPGTFSFLGFTHYWGKSRKQQWIVRRKTAKDRFTRTMHRLHEWCRMNRHLKVRYQHEQLDKKLEGHDRYYGITGNWQALSRLRQALRRTWKTWLGRRSQTGYVSWDRFNRLLATYPLTPPRIYHRV